MTRLLVLAAALITTAGCGTNNRLLDPVHTVEISPEKSEADRWAESRLPHPPDPLDKEERIFGRWP
jgi:hypothetical protein